MKYFQNAAVGVAGAALVADQPCGQILLVASPTNTVNIFIGDSTAQTFPLAPGQAISIRVAANANELWVRSASGTSTVNWMVDASWVSSNSSTITGSTVASSWTVTADSVANTLQTLTRALVAGKSHYVTMIEVSISGGAAANPIFVTLMDGATIKWKESIGSGAPRGTTVGFTTPFPILITAGVAVGLVVDAGGVGVVTTANLGGYTV